jgi:hypothetical protein
MERRRLDSEDLQRSPGRQMRLLDEADNFEPLGCGEPHDWSPHPSTMLFLSTRNLSACSAFLCRYNGALDQPNDSNEPDER